MVFEHRSTQSSIRTAPLPIIRDHHSSHRYRKKNGVTAAALAMAGNGQKALSINSEQSDNNNNKSNSNSNSNNHNNYHQKLINLFKGNNQQATNGQHTASKPIAIINGKSNNNHNCRIDSLPETPPIDSSLLNGARDKHEGAQLDEQHEKYSYRQRPLTIEEYEKELRTKASDLQLIERIFYGGIGSNKLRAALWPLIFGLVKHRGCFIRKSPSFPDIIDVSPNGARLSQSLGRTTSTPAITRLTTNGTAKRKFEQRFQRESSKVPISESLDDNFVYIEHEENVKRWRELEQLYRSYESQWKSITADQESRFSLFRERKALIERDVIRSDRTHPFYADSSTNLNNFTTLLMTYMMYDFDIGYLQGMSDLAAPILYVYQGDLVKSFWVFVEVMKLFRRNFEQSQRTIHFQLNCLYRLIKLTEPKLAYHLRDNECSNCFFVFRCIVCQFKRELMKSRSSSAAGQDPDQAYAEVLNLWDTIWSVERRNELLNSSGRRHPTPPSCQLTETEKFILSLCLSLIRRERDHILKCLDASEIHQHFINPHLTRHFDQFVEQAYGVYQYLNSDCDLQLLIRGADRMSGATSSDLSPICNDLLAAEQARDEAEPDTYDLLKDYLIISPTAYNIPLLSATSEHNTSNNLTSSNAANADSPRLGPVQANSPSHVSRWRPRISTTEYGASQRSWDHFLHRDECLV